MLPYLPYTLNYSRLQFITLRDIIEQQLKSTAHLSLLETIALAKLDGKLSSNMNSIIIDDQNQLQILHDIIEEWVDSPRRIPGEVGTMRGVITVVRILANL